jgi:hypothetical protein
MADGSMSYRRGDAGLGSALARSILDATATRTRTPRLPVLSADEMVTTPSPPAPDSQFTASHFCWWLPNRSSILQGKTGRQTARSTLFPTRRSTTSVVGLASSYPGGYACQRTGRNPQLYIPANCYNRLCSADLNAKLASRRPVEKSTVQIRRMPREELRGVPPTHAQNH